MPELDDHIRRIKDKMQQLLKKHQFLQKEVERQNRLISELKQAKEKDILLIETLSEQLSLLKAAAGQLDEPSKKELEKNINLYIREIDKCISFLSE